MESFPCALWWESPRRSVLPVGSHCGFSLCDLEQAGLFPPMPGFSPLYRAMRGLRSLPALTFWSPCVTSSSVSLFWRELIASGFSQAGRSPVSSLVGKAGALAAGGSWRETPAEAPSLWEKCCPSLCLAEKRANPPILAQIRVRELETSPLWVGVCVWGGCVLWREQEGPCTQGARGLSGNGPGRMVSD